MINKIVSLMRPHYPAIAKLCVRDTELLVVASALLCALCWSIGHPYIALFVAVSLFCLEGMLRLLVYRKPPFHTLSQSQVLICLMAIVTTTPLLYTLPALYLASDPSFAIKITGLLFVMGAQVYIANSWSGIPVLIYMILVPSMIMLVLAFINLSTTDPVVSSMTHWGIAVGFLLLFIYSSIDTIHQSITTQAALFEARDKASSRLSQLEEAHRHDGLTGLLNRPAFDLALTVMLEDRALNGDEIGVFLLDLDCFKPINDTYSHEAGDEVLLQTARRLTAHVGEMGIVGRLGGDEFICAVHGLVDPQDALHYGDALSRALSGDINWNARRLKIGVSIGVAVTGQGASAPTATVSALCAAADQAMFAAKSSPHGGPVLYDAASFAPRMSATDKQALVDGLSSGAVTPYYQPKIHLPTGRIIGFEALARWQHPKTGVRHPDDFIKHINEMGLQGDFMLCITNQVVEDVANMLSNGLDPGQVSLNVPEIALATHTGRQDLERIIAKHPQVAQHLTFEITEDVFIARAADAIQASISTFRALGVRISLDDFGTGFASFHHLRQLDFDELKIDTSFVAGLGHDTTAEVLVRGFLTIASGLGVSVIAEGVETEAQSRDLINMGCLTAQGFLFSAAVPLDKALDMLEKQQAA